MRRQRMFAANKAFLMQPSKNTKSSVAAWMFWMPQAQGARVSHQKMAASDAKREAMARVVQELGVSQRPASEVLSVDRSGMRYRSIRSDGACIRETMKKVASERRRFGYRRIHLILYRQGIIMNLKKLRRLYREEKLCVRKRSGHKRVLETRLPLALSSRSNDRWSPLISSALR